MTWARFRNSKNDNLVAIAISISAEAALRSVEACSVTCFQDYSSWGCRSSGRCPESCCRSAEGLCCQWAAEWCCRSAAPCCRRSADPWAACPGFELADPGLFELGSLALGLFGFDEPGFMFPGESLPAPGVCGLFCGFVPPVEGFPAVPAPPGVEPCAAEPDPVEPCAPAPPAEPLPPAPPAPPPACATAQAEQPRSTTANTNFLGEFIVCPRYRSFYRVVSSI
jgi:hypothetical protein